MFNGVGCSISNYHTSHTIISSCFYSTQWWVVSNSKNRFGSHHLVRLLRFVELALPLLRLAGKPTDQTRNRSVNDISFSFNIRTLHCPICVNAAKDHRSYRMIITLLSARQDVCKTATPHNDVIRHLLWSARNSLLITVVSSRITNILLLSCSSPIFQTQDLHCTCVPTSHPTRLCASTPKRWRCRYFNSRA